MSKGGENYIGAPFNSGFRRGVSDNRDCSELAFKLTTAKVRFGIDANRRRSIIRVRWCFFRAEGSRISVCSMKRMPEIDRFCSILFRRCWERNFDVVIMECAIKIRICIRVIYNL